MFGGLNRREKKEIERLKEVIREHGIVAAYVANSQPGEPLDSVSRMKLEQIVERGEEASEGYHLLVKHLERLTRQRDLYERTLQGIHAHCGAICDNFMECTHATCNSSAYARIAAGDALMDGFEIAGRNPHEGESWKGCTIGPFTFCLYRLAPFQLPRIAISENGARQANHHLAISVQVWRSEFSIRIDGKLGWASLLTRWIPDNHGRGYSVWIPFGLADRGVVAPHEEDKVRGNRANDE